MVLRDGGLDILLVEDSPGDARLVAEGLRESGVPHRLHLARDGAEGLAYLRREGPHAGAPRPDLVLLDLNLPRVPGLAVLAALKADPALRAIPVIVLTSSSAEADIRRGYDLRANAYVTKPIDLDAFIAAVRETVAFWHRRASLPPPAPA